MKAQESNCPENDTSGSLFITRLIFGFFLWAEGIWSNYTTIFFFLGVVFLIVVVVLDLLLSNFDRRDLSLADLLEWMIFFLAVRSNWLKTAFNNCSEGLERNFLIVSFNFFLTRRLIPALFLSCLSFFFADLPTGITHVVY